MQAEYAAEFERVTFHPDYSYANFVGTYKPVPKGDSITYKFVPGPFMRVLKKALSILYNFKNLSTNRIFYQQLKFCQKIYRMYGYKANYMI